MWRDKSTVNGPWPMPFRRPASPTYDLPIVPFAPGADFGEIRGQEPVKRGREVAAAGAHNVLMSGPPGAGKTLLARALPSILPPMSTAERHAGPLLVRHVAGVRSAGDPLASLPQSARRALRHLELDPAQARRRDAALDEEELDADDLVGVVEVEDDAGVDLFGLDDRGVVEAEVERVGLGVETEPHGRRLDSAWTAATSGVC